MASQGIFADSRGVGWCEHPKALSGSTVFSPLPKPGFIFINLSLSPLLVHATFFPHSLVLTVQSVLAYNTGFPDPVSSLSPFFLLFPPSTPALMHNSLKHTFYTHGPSLWFPIWPASFLPPSYLHFFSFHLVRQDVISPSPLGSSLFWQKMEFGIPAPKNTCRNYISYNSISWDQTLQ